MILRIKELLKEKKITTYQLAEKLGTTQSAVSQAMNGNPSVEWLNRVAQFLGVPITDLFERESTNEIICPKCGTRLEVKQKE